MTRPDVIAFLAEQILAGGLSAYAMASPDCLIYVGIWSHEILSSFCVFDAEGPVSLLGSHRMIRCLTCGGTVADYKHIPLSVTTDEQAIFDLIDSKLHD